MISELPDVELHIKIGLLFTIKSQLEYAYLNIDLLEGKLDDISRYELNKTKDL